MRAEQAGSSEEKLRSYLKRVAAELLDTRERLAAATADEEPIAIVGMGCRFPGGVRAPEDLWRLVLEGGSGITAAPDDRGWTAGETAPRFLGGFLQDVADFDADLFEISPREALAMDPQHRLLLELTWETLERAGIPADSLRGSQTGVYIGMMSGDYSTRLTATPEGATGFDGFLLNGNGSSIASGRIAYLLGLHGPAVTMDTACSSALVALHAACHGLRRGDCATALVGASAVMSTPTLLVEFDRQGGLAADGRCKAFAAAADGTSFAEGAGVLVLQRLSEARRAGREVLAIVRGSAVNSDGASNGMTAPNGAAQQAVIRQALASAGLTPDQIDAVEAHGTGTTLGDPIEGQALLAAYGRHRPADRPLLLGSVKSNIGHTQAAAGLAGVIKMVEAMRHGVLPPTLGIDRPTPHVDWSEGGVRLLTEAAPWPETGAPRRAGISSFSMSGTNAHVVIEQAPAATEAVPERRPLPAVPVTLSAKSAAALREQAASLITRLDDDPSVSDLDAGFTLATGRSLLRHRAVVVGTGRQALRAGLSALAGAEPAANLMQGVAAARRRGAVFVFPGQGHQWAGMAARLMDSSPVFAARVRECEAAFEPYLDWSLADVLYGRDGARSLDDDEVVHPALFTMMVSLAALWRSYGVEPVAVIGHSQGEIAAACVAGALSLADAARAIVVRGRAIKGGLSGRGGMVSISATPADVATIIAPWAGRLSIGAHNGPTSTAVSGDLDALDELLAACERDGTRARRVPIGYAAHSPHVDAIEADLRDTLSWIRPVDGAVPFYSTVTGGLVDGRELTGGYWFENLRRPVAFTGTAEALLADGHRVFVECSAHPVLTHGLAELVDGTDAIVTGTLRRGDGGMDRLLMSLGEVHVRGGDVDWPAVFAGSGAQRCALPTYPFQHQRYWVDVPVRAAGDVSAAGLSKVDHPLLDAAVDLATGDGVLLAGRLSAAEQAWIADHAVAGTVLLPGTSFVELAAYVATRHGLGEVAELALHEPLILPAGADRALQVAVGDPDAEGRRRLTIHSRPGDAAGEPWTLHASGILGGTSADTSWHELRGAWPPPAAEPVDIAGLYDRLVQFGYRYGPAFQGLRAVWRRGDEIFAEVALPEPAGDSRYTVHPALLDSALHALSAGTATAPEAGPPYAPFSWQRVALRATGSAALRVRLLRRGPEEVEVLAADGTGAPVLSVGSLVMRPLPLELLRATMDSALFRLDWPIAAPPSAAPARVEHCAVLGGEAAPEAAQQYPDLDALRRALDAGAPAPELVLAPIPLVDTVSGTGSAVRAVLGDVLRLLQGWLADDRLRASRLAILTTGAVAVGAGEVPDPCAASVWGLVRAAQTEQPGRFHLVDTDGTAQRVRAAVATGEPQLAVRAGSVLAARLVRVAAPPPAEAPPAPTGTVLVTGGLGTLGGLLARHLVKERGATRLLLAGRRGADTPEAADLVKELESLGATVTVARCDVSDRAALAETLAAVPPQHPLTAVFHLAGGNDDGVVAAMSPERLDRVLRPKVDAAVHLHELTRDAELTEFVLFTSLSGVLGGSGQANYAAANAFLDAFAEYRRALGLPGQALAWGFWAAGGLAAGLTAVDTARLAAAGLAPMPSDQALALLDAARRTDVPALVTAHLDLPALRAAAHRGGLPHPLRGLVRVPAARDAVQQPAGAPARLAEELSTLDEADQLGKLLEVVCGQVAAVLGHQGAGAAVIEQDRPFKELGFDSLTAVELSNRLGTVTGLPLPATLVFDYPNAVDLAAYLRTELTTKAGPTAGAVADPVAAAIGHLREVVSVGALDEPSRDSLVSQLRDLIREWAPAPEPAAAWVGSADPDEVLALLDEQLERH